VELRVVLEPDPDTDPEDAERLGRQLRDELRDLDVDDVEPVEGVQPPAGAKSGVLASLTEWLVTVGGGGVIGPVIGTIKAWLARGAGSHKVTVTIDGDTLELGRATDAERGEIVDAFVRRHQPV
jgi:membrane-associated two-gene conflict system component 1 (EACC1)